eukprot:TRINITY_DN6355_c0_g1_i1.p1 TRINITY_DN6355_c0_g1~~TRINITY_DN6355_c0_g1_i1.p1  ORF type:complete len:414 (-),score=48.41 TRINITY_DN6355_c0_g1_i1:47-1288(-)
MSSSSPLPTISSVLHLSQSQEMEKSDCCKNNTPSNRNVTMVPLLTSNFEEDSQKTMLCRLHQAIHQHLIVCGLSQTAKIFEQKSEFFPVFRAASPSTLTDSLSSAWSKFYFEKQFPNKEFVPQNNANPRVIVNHDKAIFCCPYPDCKGAFTTFANMKRHEKLHTGDKPYICDFEGCGKPFARKYDLKVHSKVHNKDKPHQCTYKSCRKKFEDIQSLHEHEYNAHGIGMTIEESPKRRKIDEVTKMTTPHEHRPGCGHSALIHEGHADFLVPDAYGIHRLHHCHRGITEVHVLRDTPHHPCICSPLPAPGHSMNHVHGPGCGHTAIQHEDHIDYLVDGMLHSPHNGHCDAHGVLQLLPNFDEWDGLLNCTWSYCNASCGTEENCENCKCRQESPPLLPHDLEEAFLNSIQTDHL